MKSKMSRLCATLFVFALSSYTSAKPIFPPSTPPATPDQIAAALSGTRPLTDLRHIAAKSHTEDVQASVAGALNAISDPTMRTDAAGVSQILDKPFFATMYDKVKNVRPDLLNGPEGYHLLGASLLGAAIQNVSEGGSEANTQILWNRGVAWKKLAGTEAASYPSSAPWAPELGSIDYLTSQMAEARKNIQEAAAEKQQKAEDETTEAASQKRLAKLLAERKDVGDQICDKNGNLGYVEQVHGNKVEVSFANRVTVGAAQVNQFYDRYWTDYNQVYKCSAN